MPAAPEAAAPPNTAPRRLAPAPAAEVSWLVLSVLTALVYISASWGPDGGAVLWRLAGFQALPALGAALWLWRRADYLR